MSRKIRIGSALALAGALFIAAPATALAGSPLLSGYGGPGAGEQAIVGAALLNGPHGGSGSGGSGSSGSGSSSGGSVGSTGGGGESSVGSSTGAGSTGSAHGSGSAQARAHTGSGAGSSSTRTPLPSSIGAPQTGGARNTAGRGARTFVYPSSLANASSDTSVIGMSGGDVLLLIGIIASLTLLGALTLRLARLQH
ncbi:MAG TPA: hypothetical protein VK781_11525 [Solirubrobacteraceae bacterium]|jgi:hypothetical protein|nr:hypothetical protein [Solirubrobacteraceae bacterium]